MKKRIITTALIALVAVFLFTGSLQADPRRVVLEFATGTWCGYCPCGDAAAEQMLVTYPNMIVIAYHGASSDPWQNFEGNAIRSLMGFAAYPTASIDRMNHPGNGTSYPYVTYNMWAGLVSTRYSSSGTSIINLAVTNNTYNEGTRTLNVTVNATALQTLSSQYKISFILTEDNVVYPQVFYATCGTAGTQNDYIHKWIARSMVNGATGENLNTGVWNQNQVITKSITKVIDNTFIPYNCKISAIVYKDSSAGVMFSEVQQGIKQDVPAINGINPQHNGIPVAFELSQNYPNPFNPTTSIKFAVPKDGNVSLKIYDILGNEVATYMEGFVKAGYYNADVDASSWASGVYFYTLRGDNFTDSKKFTLLK